MKTTALTNTQYDVLCSVMEYINEYGYPPSTHELCERLRMTSTSSVVYQLRQLQAKGYIERQSGRARAITILKGPEE